MIENLSKMYSCVACFCLGTFVLRLEIQWAHNVIVVIIMPETHNKTHT